ncbi:DUF2652 domain-containing protein [Roseivirga sp. E12]|uniref:DUF2652 domain-containing protein n=1 Tax=Roseivirga sp. E12 TaxID=2819237 RepID=UPI001ABD0D2D|nr:DUF2652 domain-containing protein [Roseivirga sp. E12]MBO3700434.1 DUF2652 domain-containing protein [Roseivirga sp. E12]
MQQATILIPDISGYTSFMTKTELSHSTHIINELLQVIADSVQSKFTLAEIEGDALLTYANGRVSLEEIEAICSQAFKNFHYFLKVIERDSVCRCGACNNASALSLKFIVHYGMFEEIKIAQFTKLSGADMIIAHRLMKNSVPSREYILATDAYNIADEQSGLDWEVGEDHYDLIGKVPYCYAPIGYLKEDVLDPESAEDYSSIFGLARVMDIEIEAPLQEVHAVLTDNGEKSNFVDGLIDMKMDSSINRIGSTHICEFDGDTFDIKTLQDVGERDQIVYIEKARSVNSGMTMLAYYELKKTENGTRLSFRALTGDRQPIPVEFSDMIYGQAMHNLGRMKDYVEKQQVA